MTTNDTTKKQIPKSKRFSPMVDAFLEEFQIDDEKIIPQLVAMYIQALTFITYRGLQDDYVFFCEDETTYKKIMESNFLKHQHDTTEN